MLQLAHEAGEVSCVKLTSCPRGVTTAPTVCPLGVLIPEPFIDRRPFYLLFCPKSCWLLAAILFHDPRSTIRVGHLGQHITILLLPSIHEVYQAVQRNGRNFCWGQVSNNLHQFHTISHDITQNFVCILFKNFINKIGIKIFKMISSWK